MGNTQDHIHGKKMHQKSILSGGLVVLIICATFITGYLLGSGRISLSFASGSIPQISKTKTTPSEGVDQLYSELKSYYDGTITDEQVLEGIKSGLVNSTGDPYTEYLSPEEKSGFEDSLNGSFEGIGAELSREGSFIIVVSPIKGTPAFRAGIQPQDIITEIDGESAAGITVSEAVDRIRGPKGEQVTLGIVRSGEQIEVTITRDTISVPSVEFEVVDAVGVITIGRFGTDTNALVRQAAEQLKESNVKGVILDLRGNPGGLLDSAVFISSLWLDNGKEVLTEKRGEEVVNTYTAKGDPILLGVPTVVLIDSGSASASEIVAGALRDQGVATLVGVKSFGKGSVQRLIDLSDGGSLKVTIARWYTPNNNNIDKEGINPDVEIAVTDEDRSQNKDPQFLKALELIKGGL